MYMREPRTEAPRLQHGRLLWSGLAVTTVLVIVLGLFPTTVFNAVSEAAQALPPIEVTQASN